MGLGRNIPYIGSLEARVLASNKERLYGLVCPNPSVGFPKVRKSKLFQPTANKTKVMTAS